MQCYNSMFQHSCLHHVWSKAVALLLVFFILVRCREVPVLPCLRHLTGVSNHWVLKSKFLSCSPFKPEWAFGYALFRLSPDCITVNAERDSLESKQKSLKLHIQHSSFLVPGPFGLYQCINFFQALDMTMCSQTCSVRIWLSWNQDHGYCESSFRINIPNVNFFSLKCYLQSVLASTRIQKRHEENSFEKMTMSYQRSILGSSVDPIS